MPRIVHSQAEWRAILLHLTGSHEPVAPPGLLARVRALLSEAPNEWPDERFALDLDAGSADAVRAAQAGLAGGHPNAGQRAASVAEAEAVVRDHQRRP